MNEFSSTILEHRESHIQIVSAASRTSLYSDFITEFARLGDVTIQAPPSGCVVSVPKTGLPRKFVNAPSA